MTETFEDMPDGAGKRATEEDYQRIWLHMKSRNRHPSVRSVITEIGAQNFLPPSIATSQRWARKLGLSEKVVMSTTKDADMRSVKRRNHQNSVAPMPTAERLAEKTGQTPQQVVISLKARMTDLLKAENSSTQLAITENRTRMAFNVALMEFYAEQPGLLVNVRDAAAFLDATTIAAKLSGGPSIDIVLPQNGDVQPDGVSPNGYPMKTLGPVLDKIEPSLVTSFKDFKARLRDGAGT